MTNNELYSKQYLYKQIVQAKLFIDENFQNKIDLDAICSTACFSKFHFIRLFKNTFDRTPHQYLTRIRLSKAKDLLAGSTTVSDVCFNVGFDSVSSFKLLFKKYAGLTPSAWQRHSARRIAAMKETPQIFTPGCFVDGRLRDKKQFSIHPELQKK